MGLFIKVIDRITDTLGIIAGLFMVSAVLMVLTEVILRTVFDGTLYITQEYTAYFMVAVTFFGLAYTLKEKGHIRLSFLHRFVKFGKPQTILDIVAFVFGFIMFAIITYASYEYFMSSWESMTRSRQISQTYLAIPQAAMPLGSL